MQLVRAIIWRAGASVAVAGLAACATPSASPNAGASVPATAAQLASKPSVGQEVAAVASNKVEILFPAGGDALTPEANEKLDLAARLFRDANPVAMFTTGYTDQSGDEYNNLLLSGRRAEAVKRALVARGIPANRLLVQAMGESEPSNSADPLAPENRRVTITWRLL